MLLCFNICPLKSVHCWWSTSVLAKTLMFKIIVPSTDTPTLHFITVVTTDDWSISGCQNNCPPLFTISSGVGTWSAFSRQIIITAATSAFTFSLNKTLIKPKQGLTLSNWIPNIIFTKQFPTLPHKTFFDLLHQKWRNQNRSQNQNHLLPPPQQTPLKWLLNRAKYHSKPLTTIWEYSQNPQPTTPSIPS